MIHTPVMAISSPEILELSEPDCGLSGYIVLDSTRLGPAAGGVRTRAYDSKAEALVDAKALARAMTIKCALGGLTAGGGKAVIMDHPGLRRAEAFQRLGEIVESLEGRFRTAGDLGTTRADLEIMASQTQYVHIEEADLSRSVAAGLYYCMKSCAEFLSRDPKLHWSVSVQGYGAIGRSVAELLAEHGHLVTVSDIDPQRLDAVSFNTIDADSILFAEADILAPCAIGGVITESLVSKLRVPVICGAANNIVANDETHRLLHESGILFVPDVIASAGGVIDGIGLSVMELADRGPLIRNLQTLTTKVLTRSKQENRPPQVIAHDYAMQIIQS